MGGTPLVHQDCSRILLNHCVNLNNGLLVTDGSINFTMAGTCNLLLQIF
jgi:hypothetical protein